MIVLFRRSYYRSQ